MKNINVIIDTRMIKENNMTGIARYTYELIVRNSTKVNYTLLTNNIEKTKKIFNKCSNLKFIKVKSKFLSIYEQIELPFVLNKYKDTAIFHTPSFVSSPFLNIKSIMTIHDLNHIKLPQFYSTMHKYYYKYIVKKCAQKSQKILTVSNFSKNEIIQWLDCSKDKVAVTYNGISDRFFNIDKTQNERIIGKYKLPDRFILYVGNHKPHKNVSRLIEAFSEIEDDECRLVLSGQTNEAYNEIIAKKHIKEKIQFIGFIEDEDLPNLYNLAEVFVFPSLYEGFGLPPLEALASGGKAVTSNNSSLGEIFRDIAVTVDPYNINDICKGINICLASEMVNPDKVIKYIKDKFNWDKMAERTFEEYYKCWNYEYKDNR